MYPMTLSSGESANGGKGRDTLKIVSTEAAGITDEKLTAINVENIEVLSLQSINASADITLDDAANGYDEIIAYGAHDVTIDADSATKVTVKAGNDASVTANKAKSISVTAGGAATVASDKSGLDDNNIETISVKASQITATLASANVVNFTVDGVNLSTAAADLSNGNSSTVENLTLKNITDHATNAVTIKGKDAKSVQNITVSNLKGSNGVKLVSTVSKEGVVTSTGNDNAKLNLATAFTKLTINANTSSKATTAVSDVATSATIKDIVITGKGNVEFTNHTTPVTKFTADASTATGNVAIKNVKKDASITLGAGDDRVVMKATEAVQATTKLVGGEGNDTLVLGTTTGNSFDGVSGFETVGIAASGTSGFTLDMSNYTKFNDVLITDLNLTSNLDATVSNIKNGSALTVEQTTATDNKLTLQMAGADADAESVTLNLGKSDAELGGVTLAKIALGDTGHDIETLNIVSLGAGKDVKHTITAFDISKSAGVNVVATGKASLTFSDTTASIDASALEGKLEATVGASNITIKGGKGDDTITLATGKYASIDVSAGGNDKIALVTGIKSDTLYNTISGLNAGDKITFAAAPAGASTKLASTSKYTNVNEDLDVAHNIQAAIAMNENGSNNAVIWFNYKGNTYVIQDSQDTSAANKLGTVSTDDSIVKLVGTYDLSAATVSSTDLTLA